MRYKNVFISFNILMMLLVFVAVAGKMDYVQEMLKAQKLLTENTEEFKDLYQKFVDSSITFISNDSVFNIECIDDVFHVKNVDGAISILRDNVKYLKNELSSYNFMYNEFISILNTAINSKGVHLIDLPVDYSLNHLILNELLQNKSCLV